MQQYGNTTTFNIERVLYQNAIDSLYFKNNCVKLSTFDELVDEVGDRRSASLSQHRLSATPLAQLHCKPSLHALHA